MKLHYQKFLKPFAQKLRGAGNLSEVLLWREIKSDKLGYRFLRQVPIKNYIVDFYCTRLRIAIEIDGAATHNNKVEKDEIRYSALEASGLRVLRFKDADVRYNIGGVIQTIKTEILRRVSVPPPFGKEE